MIDWYRQTAWNKEIEEFFFKKLARARKESRAQYLKIQAIELIGTKQLTLLDAAEMLIQKLFNDYPDNRIDRSASLNALGDIHKLKGNLILSLDHYKRALDHEEIFPNVITHAYLYFAELVIKLKKEEYYSIAESTILNRKGPDSPFPIERYKSYSFLSIINFLKGDYNKAFDFADLAELCASAKISDFRNHKNLGVVTRREIWIDDLVAYYKIESNRDKK